MPDAALDWSPGTVTCNRDRLAILDASGTPAGLLYIVPLGVIFRDKPQNISSGRP